MRISIVRGDRGYDPTHTRRIKRVTLNGLSVASVTADEELGYVDELCMEDGKVVMIGDQPVTRRMTGKVVIELLPKNERDWDAERKMPGVKVQVGRDRNRDILVQVVSWARPGAIKQGRMDYASLPATPAAQCQKAGAAAGMLAEMLCTQFGDRLDPSEAAKVAIEQCAKMLSEER